MNNHGLLFGSKPSLKFQEELFDAAKTTEHCLELIRKGVSWGPLRTSDRTKLTIEFTKLVEQDLLKINFSRFNEFGFRILHGSCSDDQIMDYLDELTHMILVDNPEAMSAKQQALAAITSFSSNCAASCLVEKLIEQTTSRTVELCFGRYGEEFLDEWEIDELPVLGKKDLKSAYNQWIPNPTNKKFYQVYGRNPSKDWSVLHRA